MKLETVGDRRVLQRSSEEKTPLIQRLARIEGQVRGLRQMVEDNRYCGDALQQTNAVIAAVREVGLLLISQQLHAQIEDLSKIAAAGVLTERPKGMDEVVDLLRSTYRL